ncbi:MAG: transposase [Deltaproteobacteria bacterium]|nr:transposase [Deltaproteobacteria bacterium]
MARPLRIEYPCAFYHVTSRGNEQKEILKNDKDKEKFISYLESATIRYDAAIHAYCLMNNHYHLLIETPSGNLSQIMRHINGAYTTYFNLKRKRAGHLLQGRYKAILVDADEYAQELSRYIHLNPVRAGITERPEEYAWSSYKCYISKGKKPEWLRIEFILRYFGKKEADAQKKYRLFVDSVIGSEYENPLVETIASTILGSADFVKEITKKYLNDKQKDRNLPALRQLFRKPTTEKIMDTVKSVIADDEKLSKVASIYFCHRYSGVSLKEIGIRLGIGESAVSQASRRFAIRAANDSKLKKTVEKIEGAIKVSRV